MIENITRITCNHCGRVIEISGDLHPFLLQIYLRYGWTNYMDDWFCDECRPEKIKIDHCRHPHYSDYRDYWDRRKPEDCKSHYFENEPYDPYADLLQDDLCKCCRYMSRGYEEDGSDWLMCCINDPDDYYGHNLYSGHFYGAAIAGRICPYFTNEHWQGRDPEKDKKNGCFHVPYNELYDGD